MEDNILLQLNNIRASPASLQPETPRTITYSINMNTARTMKLVIPDDVVRGAKQTF